MYDAITVAAGSSQNKKTASARSDGRQGGRRPGLQAQRRALAAACRRRGWQPLERPARSAKERARPGSTPPLATEQAEDTTLAASTLARPDQALLELAALVTSAQRQGWALTALHCTPETTPTDQELAAVQATFAACEQQPISERTRAALARARARGVRLGRPPTMPAHLIKRIHRERKAGSSLAAIANRLNADRIPTTQGGQRWYPATIRHTLNRTS